MNLLGFWLGIVMLACIGAGFALVIRVERFLGYLWWPYILSLGVILVLISLFIPDQWGSGSCGILGASVAWGATELKEQAKRAEAGWYPFQRNKYPPPFAEIIQKWKAPHL